MKKHRTYKSAAALLMLTSTVFTTPAMAADNFWDAISSGTASGSLRLRSESVDDSVNKDASALTLRTRLGYSTDSLAGFGATLEFDQVSILAGEDEYAPVTAGYATIADPRSTEMNQAYLSYAHDIGFSAKLGRQRILLDNQRFVGAVGWRQDDQTFDALSLVYKKDALFVHYSYIDRVNGILPAFDASTSHNLLNVSYQWLPELKTTFYSYYLKDDDDPAAAKNADTTGLRLNGKIKAAEKLFLTYVAEGAAQKAEDFDTTYLFAELGVAYSGLAAAVGQEVLGSDDGAYGFQTPLATKHAFNGWADKFLATPANGLEDSYMKVAYSYSAFKAAAFYHSYKADEGNSTYGDEVDVVMTYKVHKQLSVGVKYADYSAEDFSNDTEKYWVWTQLTF